MRKRLILAVATLLALATSMVVAVPPAHAAVGLRVVGRNIVEANGNTFVMRGTSHPHVWFPSQTTSFANIKSLGANTVRVVLGSGQRWGPNSAADVSNVIALCKAARLICVLEVHDTTGFGEEGAAATLDQAATYWISIASALMGQENYVVINIGNEPFGNNQTVSATWATATSNAIVRLRNAGFDHLIMVDGPMWGQDWQNIMRNNAAQVFNADPDRNTVFSIHMYEVYGTATAINTYFDAFQTAGLPLVVGEFGHMHNGQNVDEDTIMAQAQARGIGYIGWSWSGNSGGTEFLDMVNQFNVNSLTPWGQRIFNGANGIASTSREATVYGNPCNDTSPPTTPGAPAVSNVTSTGATLTWTASTDVGCSGLAGYNVYREQGATDPILGQSTGNTLTLTTLTPATQYQVYVRARDNAGNLSNASSPLVTFTTGQSCNDTTPPSVPGTPTVSGITSSSANLSWSASTDSGCSGLAGYNVYRELGANDQLLMQVSSNSAALTQLSANTQYQVYVRARDNAGNLSGNSGLATFTTGGGGGGCSVAPTVQTQWQTGYVIEPARVTNTGTSTITSWQVTFTLPAGHTVVGFWRTALTVNGQTVTARNLSYNGTIGAGASDTFGFQVSRPNGNTALPTGYTCVTPAP